MTDPAPSHAVGAPHETLVETPSALTEVISRAASAPRLALDVEANGRFAFRARLSMMQLGWGDGVALVDPLAPEMAGALRELSALFGATGPVKVIHDVGFDARLLADAGLTLGNVHDTALMAQWLGRPGTGLATLAQTELGVTLDKSLQAEDWAARPLSNAALLYLAADIEHLFKLDDILFAEATASGIVPELDLEIAYRLRAAEKAVREPDQRPPYIRLKGLDAVAKTDLPVLRRVAMARATEAERLDAPEAELVPSALLLVIARVKPKTVQGLARIRWPIARKDNEAVARAIVEAVRVGAEERALPAEDIVWLERPKLAPAVVKDRRERESRLMAWRKKEAATRAVSDQVVLPGHCASEIVVRAPSSLPELEAIDGFGASRVARYGHDILAALGPPSADVGPLASTS